MNMEHIETLLEKKEFHCPVCGNRRYVTDHGHHEWTVHCSSAEARFWDFERGTMAQRMAMQHWDQSRLELFFTVEDVLRKLE
ncbi:MAG TPA: hypothetical protein VHE34_27745 [Puia sp.]|uniref:hypothetical protein n=1 Tax=Puia sp. TaxID=2045100 RepID=UPI002B89121C|nr:hypothetical protein [Puia sp.]HVU99059.1 hypothetical protein [Puia sp.]